MALKPLGLRGAVVLALAGCGGDKDAPRLPAAPSGLVGIAMAGGCHLSWTDNSGNEDSFVVERRDGGSDGFQEVEVTLPETDNWHDPGPFAHGVVYTFRVRARNDAGDSPPSNEYEFHP